MQIKIEKTTQPRPRPNEATLGFGTQYTDHMFVMPYDEGEGWHSPEIIPYAPFMLDPAAMVFHYAQECFEGLKAYRTEKGLVQIFRPDKNAERMATTFKRLCIPEMPKGMFENAVKELMSVEKEWTPYSENTSMYIRPCAIATEPQLGVRKSNNYLFYIICSPSGPYYANGLAPIKIYVEDDYTRAAPGGTGSVKCGGNYAASLKAQSKAAEHGYDQVLWLDGVEKRFVEEVGSMNCFFVVNGEVFTAPVGDTVLPGITRMSCIELLQDQGVKVWERRISIEDVMEATSNGQLTEIFGTGTAAVVSPVGEICYKGQNLQIADGKPGEITMKLYNELTAIQWGKVKDTKGWMVPVK